MNDICQFVCPYRTPSGYCGSTGGYATCPHRKMYEPPTIKSAEPIKPITNADKYFRNATDEEIAQFVAKAQADILRTVGRALKYPGDLVRDCDLEDAADDWLDWLKQEVNE